MSDPLEDIMLERKRQEKKWGEQNHDDLYWLGILTEELGETAKAAIEYDFVQMRKELIETVAVGLSWLECIDRRTAELVEG